MKIIIKTIFYYIILIIASPFLLCGLIGFLLLSIIPHNDDDYHSTGTFKGFPKN